MSTEDKIYRIVPVAGGFEATWGFDPSLPQPNGQIQDWTTDVLRPYTGADARSDALAVAALEAERKAEE